jgi:hypothetical protein
VTLFGRVTLVLRLSASQLNPKLPVVNADGGVSVVKQGSEKS